jgi:nucleotide-binding universal stress UspA family protein
MSSDRKKLLLAMDGSDQAFDAACYLSTLLAAGTAQVVLFYVLNKIPEAFWDWEKDPLWPKQMESLKNWEVQQHKKIRNFMERSRQVFVEAGFAPDRVTVNVQERKEGIARDILIEAQQGYDAVVVGRKGLSTLDDLTLGSIASKVVTRLTDTAVWLIGGRPTPGKILIAMDASEGAMRAALYAGNILAGSNCQVTLFHVVRDITSGMVDLGGIFPEGYSNRLLQEAEALVRPALAEATAGLVAAGLKPGNITSKIVTGVTSRAGTVVNEARQGGYGTIVVGRRGLSRVEEEFTMGRVSHKVTQLARDLAVWVVS